VTVFHQEVTSLSPGKQQNKHISLRNSVMFGDINQKQHYI